MAAAQNCPNCGRPLVYDGPEGLCPACLLAAGLGDAPATTDLGTPAKVARDVTRSLQVSARDRTAPTTQPPASTRAAANRLTLIQRLPRPGCLPRGTQLRYFGDYELLAETRPAAAWASSTRPGRSASTASSP